MTLTALKLKIQTKPFLPREIELRYSGEKVSYSCTGYPADLRQGEYVDSGFAKRSELEDILKTFNKRLYKPLLTESGGECWELEFTWLEDGEKPHRKRGENAWPPLWDYLLEATDDIAGNWHDMPQVRKLTRRRGKNKKKKEKRNAAERIS